MLVYKVHTAVHGTYSGVYRLLAFRRPRAQRDLDTGQFREPACARKLEESGIRAIRVTKQYFLSPGNHLPARGNLMCKKNHIYGWQKKNSWPPHRACIEGSIWHAARIFSRGGGEEARAKCHLSQNFPSLAFRTLYFGNIKKANNKIAHISTRVVYMSKSDSVIT